MLAHRCMMIVTKDRYEVPYPVSRLNQYGLNELFVYALTRRRAIDASTSTARTTTSATPSPVV